MLTQLKIKDFAIVKHLEINYSDGLSVITGETGAGKSIMVDALALALGARTESDVIRQDAQQADIIATFDCQQNLAAQQWLTAHDMYQEGECILRRTINIEGRSRAYINGIPSTMLSLRQLGQLLVNIHGQHEHQTLLQRETQRHLLDHFASHHEILNTLKQRFEQWQCCTQTLHRVTEESRYNLERTELLNYQIKELDELNLQTGELEQLEEEHRRLANVDQTHQNCHNALLLLQDNETHNAQQLIHGAIRELTQIKVSDTPLQALQTFLESITVQLEEASHDLESYLTKLESDPDRLLFLEERISLCYQLARKYRLSAHELTSHHAGLQKELEQLSHTDERLHTLIEQEKQLRAEYDTLAQTLSDARRQSALPLQNAINQCLSQLGMIDASLSIRIDTDPMQASANGYDQVEFEIITNPGQPARPLGKIVSGGELSRISLAIQVICAEKYATPTLIFDEVDVGIGGATAHIVGRLLRKLSANAQVLCVTHQAQVAAQAHHHFSVHKTSQNNSTFTEVLVLNHDNKITEIARMLGGGDLSPESLEHAKAMLIIAD